MYGCINIIKTKQAHSPGYPVYVPVKRGKLCKILNPFIFLIIFIDHRQFNDLVQIEYKVDNHNRQFQDKCADASQRNSDTADMASWLNLDVYKRQDILHSGLVQLLSDSPQ